MKLLCRFCAACAVLGSLSVCPAWADVFVLQGGGEVHGELLNPDESPRKTFVVKTVSGGQVTLDAERVKKISRQSPAEVMYDRIRGKATDTIKDQWKLAEWCRKSGLPKQRRTHLARIIELDPNHADARHGLGYSQIRGRWITQETLMKEQGYVRYKGAWLLPQEIELSERERKEKLARLDWARKLKRWEGWLGSDKAGEAIAKIRAIDDPLAAGALARKLTDEKHAAPRQVRLLYVEALGRLQASAGMNALVTASLYDVDEEIRISCLEQIVDNQYKPAVAKYVKALRDKQNPIVNRAANCLGYMKDPAAIGPLIDALVTTHSFQVQSAPPGQTTTTFGTGSNTTRGGGFTFGGSKVKTIKQQFQNRDVLRALVTLTGGSFNYDERAWKKWYAARRKPQALDARRDGGTSP